LFCHSESRVFGGMKNYGAFKKGDSSSVKPVLIPVEGNAFSEWHPARVYHNYRR